MTNGERAKKFGEALARKRQKAGFSQQSLGVEIGSTQSTISSWERGESEPPPDFVFEIERVCQLKRGELSSLLGYWQAADADLELTILSDPALSEYKRGLLRAIYREMRGLGPVT